MSSVLLIQPPIEDFYLTEKRTIPYGLACIARPLVQAQMQVEILDCLASKQQKQIPIPSHMSYLEEYYLPDISPFHLFCGYRHFGYSWEYIAKKIKASQANIVGISALCTPYYRETLRIAEIVKQVLPGAITIMGGHHAVAYPTSLLENPAVDFCILGEGENSFFALVQVIQNNLPVEHWKDIPGVCFRQKDGTYHISKPNVIQNLDILPATHLIANHFYQRHARASTVIVASRGCPMQCSYCCTNVQSWLSYRRRSVGSVLEELDHAITQYDVGFVDFEDENIALDKPWFLALLQEIEKRYTGKNIEFRAMNGLYPPSLDEELIAHMKMAGFTALNLSLGSISVQQMERFQRPNVRFALENCLVWAEKYNLLATVYIIVGAPHQTWQDSLEDIMYLASKKALIGTSIYYPAPGSRDYKTCQDLGVLPTDFALMRASVFPISHTTTRLQSVTLLRITRIINFIKNILDHQSTLPDRNNDSINNAEYITQDSTYRVEHTIDICEKKKIPNHIEEGKKLLHLFLTTGKIYGITPQGVVYQHQTDDDVCQKAVATIPNKIRGTIS